MNDTDIRNYATLMQELGLTGLEITDDSRKVRLERNVTEQIQQVIPMPGNVGMTSGDLAENVMVSLGNSKITDDADEDYISVKSPIVGVFYAASAENADPYVSVGDYVSKGQTLCIIEAMKLMNEITAEEDGIISKICVTNGQVIEYGTELFRIKK
jgi:acetyl-CoA carboxylase biotin carboxyl carrier protein